MKAVTKYQADDGDVFDTREAANERDTLCRVVAEIMAPLGPDPRVGGGCEFENGHGYVWHDTATVAGAKRALVALSRKFVPDDWLNRQESRKVDLATIHHSWFMRFTGDSGARPVAEAWYRLGCVDGDSREWGQLYYVDHPAEAEQFVLEDRRAAR